MPSRTLSSLVTVFMFLLLLAVPLLAIFGIPGQPLPESLHAGTETDDASPADPPKPELGVGESVYHPATDLFPADGQSGKVAAAPDFAPQSSAPPFPGTEFADSDMGAEVTIDERNGGLSSSAGSPAGMSSATNATGQSVALADRSGSWSPPPGALDGWEPDRTAAVRSGSQTPPVTRFNPGKQTSQANATLAGRENTGINDFTAGDPFEGQPAAPFDSTAAVNSQLPRGRAVADSGSVAASDPSAGQFAAEASDFTSGSRIPNREFADRQSAADSGTGEPQIPDAWKSALRQLEALGISEYELQPGVQEGAYHFWCAVDSRDNPRISRRFEAEADEPLLAVRKVLAQVEQWRRPAGQ